ncbi:uncharacterized protein SCHCODRAFT_02618417 [Schizophyllum commune H4-8]|uniref:uncharacterized protein n=1 Tax=Schizophyllum commune (strain H4-8 / FGSC 9210) TaxID=578458 RepID=UPI00215FAD15|nr:uncharacterized protein SCHCODRAFT_02618417 [Schizophyllum commune H4-8]KAI5895037.1 hypothetical protein SCHCODRAFT_02618417 [Schizophyllum commune H4-8]
MSSDLFSLLASKGPAPEITVHFPGSLPFTMRPIDYHHPGVDHRSFRSLSQGDDEEYHILASAPRKDGENTTFDYTAWSEKEWPAVTFCGDRRPDDDVQTSTSGSTQVRSQRLALKFANRVGARHDGFGNILHERYLEEAVFYAETLKGLQGEAVPIHYGVWTGSAPWGATVTCAIMQWAGDPYTRRIRTIERRYEAPSSAHLRHLHPTVA